MTRRVTIERQGSGCRVATDGQEAWHYSTLEKGVQRLCVDLGLPSPENAEIARLNSILAEHAREKADAYWSDACASKAADVHRRLDDAYLARRDVNYLNSRIANAHKAIRERYDAERSWVRRMDRTERYASVTAAALSDIAGNETLDLVAAERRIRRDFANAQEKP